VPLRPEIEAKRLAEELEDREKRAAELAEETRRIIDRDQRLGMKESELAELGGESFTSDDAAALARRLIMAVEAQDEAERLEAERKAAQSDAESEAAAADNVAESKTEESSLLTSTAEEEIKEKEEEIE
jgi:hypothetical protein